MASKFAKYSMTSCEEALYRLYTFVQSSGQTALRLVNDTGSAVALYSNGTGFVSSWSSSLSCPDGSYMVVEPVTAIGGVRWQAKITNAAFDTLNALFAPRGGWTNAAQNFGASAVTSDTRWNDAAAPGAGSQVYCGTGTFAIDGSNTGTYVWFNIRDSGSAGADQFLYVGGYYPWSVSYDTNPACFLTRVPTVSGSAFDLGRNGADTNNLNRTSVEVAQTTSWTAAGYARVGFYDAPNTPGSTCIWRDLQSYYPPLPAYLFLRNSACMGHFGDHLRIINDTLSDYDTDTGSTRLVLGHLWMHYDESL
jgi:hypothetical protein